MPAKSVAVGREWLEPPPFREAGGEVTMPVSEPVGETTAAAPRGGKRKSASGVAALRLQAGDFSYPPTSTFYSNFDFWFTHTSQCNIG